MKKGRPTGIYKKSGLFPPGYRNKWPLRPRGIGQDILDIQTGINELQYGPQSIPADALPIDMMPRLVQEYNRNPDGTISTATPGSPLEAYLSRIANDTDMIASTIVLTQGLLGQTITVTTTPQLIINAQFLRGYIILNPNLTAGATSAGTVLASAARTGSGNSSDIGVANFLDGHFFVNITSIVGGGNLTVTLQALDPVSGLWANVQDLITAQAATGTFYSNVGTVGIATDMRVHWSVSAGTITFSVGFVFKNGLVGTSSGIDQTIFIGGAGVTVTSGFPLLNGQFQKFFLRENVQLWAVANASLPLKIFQL